MSTIAEPARFPRRQVAWRVACLGLLALAVLFTVSSRASRKTTTRAATKSSKGRHDDAMLPAASVDVVLVVNAYHEMRQFDAMLRSIHHALRPGGLLAVIDAGGSAERDRKAHRSAHTIAESIVVDDAARNGFRFLPREPGFERTESYRRAWFFLIFQKISG